MEIGFLKDLDWISFKFVHLNIITAVIILRLSFFFLGQSTNSFPSTTLFSPPFHPLLRPLNTARWCGGVLEAPPIGLAWSPRLAADKWLGVKTSSTGCCSFCWLHDISVTSINTLSLQWNKEKNCSLVWRPIWRVFLLGQLTPLPMEVSAYDYSCHYLCYNY